MLNFKELCIERSLDMFIDVDLGNEKRKEASHESHKILKCLTNSSGIINPAEYQRVYGFSFLLSCYQVLTAFHFLIFARGSVFILNLLSPYARIYLERPEIRNLKKNSPQKANFAKFTP